MFSISESTMQRELYVTLDEEPGLADAVIWKRWTASHLTSVLLITKGKWTTKVLPCEKPSNQCDIVTGFPLLAFISRPPGPVRYRTPAAYAGIFPDTFNSMGSRSSWNVSNCKYCGSVVLVRIVCRLYLPRDHWASY